MEVPERRYSIQTKEGWHVIVIPRTTLSYYDVLHITFCFCQNAAPCFYDLCVATYMYLTLNFHAEVILPPSLHTESTKSVHMCICAGTLVGKPN